jgi:hypothetical protein
MWLCELDYSYLGWGSLEGSFEHGNEMKWREVPEFLHNWLPSKNFSIR